MTEKSTAFDSLHPKVQRWIWMQGWTGLRDVQERTINAILTNEKDIVISAPTAGGKTEAAFLPIYSQLLHQQQSENIGFNVLAISPLKALINDQYKRLLGLSEATNLSITPWHGDVSDSLKKAALKKPSGVLMITPESLESLFVNRGNDVFRLFSSLNFIVVDELHAFIASERGIQLQSLMHRIETLIGNRIRRIGLSATLGDISLAAKALRPFSDGAFDTINEPSGGAELQLQIRSHTIGLSTNLKENIDTHTHTRMQNDIDASTDISDHLFKVLRGSTNLIFAGSRGNVETYSDQLNLLSQKNNVPTEFLAHHGNLSKEIRHDVETKLKDSDRPYTAVCTTTLELGVDIGDVESVAHIGAPRSIASLKQKLGRSGRRPGQPAILRIYTIEVPLDAKTPLLDRLCLDTVMSVAAIELLVEGWCEAPRKRSLHLSTLVHQILSVIVSWGGINAADLFDLLCHDGPFRNISKQDFVKLLRTLVNLPKPMIEQSPDGLLMLGEAGEKTVEHYSFNAVFQTPEEYRVEVEGKLLGTLPVDKPLFVGATILFAGRRWDVLDIKDFEKVILVKPGRAGVPVKFGGDGGIIDKELAIKMRTVLESDNNPIYLSSDGKKHLSQAQGAYSGSGLHKTCFIQEEDSTLLFPWIGSYGLAALQLALMNKGIACEIDGLVALKCKTDKTSCFEVISELADDFPAEPMELAAISKNQIRNKYDWCLEGELLVKDYASEQLDLDEAKEGVKNMLL